MYAWLEQEIAQGRVFLPVAGLAPGETRRFSQGCYKRLIPRGFVEIFGLPDPGPEDRGRYWDFREV